MTNKEWIKLKNNWNIKKDIYDEIK